jgi:hypothetical protein
VNPPAKPKNPLRFVAIAFVGTLPFDFYSYVGHGHFIAFGVIVIVAKISFLILYMRQSRFAWHVGVTVTAAITPLSLLFIRLSGEAAEHPHSHPLFQLAVVIVLVVYLCNIREQYRQYVEARI